MKTSFKKIVATASIAALVAMNVLTGVNAANANPTFTYANGVDGIANTADDVVTVTIPAIVIANDLDTVTVAIKKDLNPFNSALKVGGETNSTVDVTDEATGIFIFTEADNAGNGNAEDITFDFTPGVAGNFTISILGTAGVGSAVAYVGNANVVNVSAVVMPFLDFAIDSNTFNLGELETGAYKTASLLVDLSTNADQGAAITVASNGLRGTTTDKFIGFNKGDGNGETTGNISLVGDATNFYKYNVSNFNGDAATTKSDAETAITAATTEMAAALNNVISVAGAETIQKGFAVGAKRAALTEADNYTDTLTFTVTGTF